MYEWMTLITVGKLVFRSFIFSIIFSIISYLVYCSA